jgi:type II secretion system protein J
MKGAREQSGFTLIEVVITVAILMSLTIAIASMLRSGFEVKTGLSEKAAMLHRLSVVMDKVARDVQFAFYVSLKDADKNGIDRKMKTIFKIDKGSPGDKLTLTTKTHQPIRSGAPESEFTYVIYELKDSQDQPGRKDLYRAETPAIPLDLRDEPPMRLLAKNIKTLTFEFWRGDDWSRSDYWDTGRGDTRNLLPKLVRITVEAYLHDAKEGDVRDEATESATDKLSTVVYVEDSGPYAELKQQASSIKWSAL